MLYKTILRNVSISSTLMGTGDCIAQYLDKSHNSKFNWRRWCHYTLINGFSNGVGLTLWYRFLEWRFPIKKPFSVLKKIALDEVIFAPISISLYIILSNYLKYRPWLHHYSSTFIDIWKTDLLIWPISNSINFKYIPVGYQPIWTSFISLGWNTFISYKTNTLASAPTPPITSGTF